MTRGDSFFVYNVTLSNPIKRWMVMKRSSLNLLWNNLEILQIRNNCLEKIYLWAWRWNKHWSALKTCGCDVAQYQWVFITSQISRLIGQDTEIKSFLTKRKISLPASTRCKANFSQFHAIEFRECNQPYTDGKFLLMKVNIVCFRCRWLKTPPPKDQFVFTGANTGLWCFEFSLCFDWPRWTGYTELLAIKWHLNINCGMFLSANIQCQQTFNDIKDVTHKCIDNCSCSY